MEDVSLLQLKITTLETENNNLKDLIEQLDAQCKALDHTLTETFKANNILKTEFLLLQNKESRLVGEVKALNTIIQELRDGNVAKHAQSM